MKAYLNTIFSGRDLMRTEAREAMTGIMTGQFEASAIAGFLTALRTKGETIAEIVGFAEAMRGQMTPVPITVEAIDMCGTGGDGSNTFNISTAASFVVAGAGVPVAKHGNRAITSNSGSADVLAALGVRIDLPPEEMGHCVDEIGLGFLFAPALHPAMKYAMPARKALGVRTVFNILGPLCNPASVKRQLIGVFDGELTDTLATALQMLGGEKGMVVHGSGGLDEFSLSGPTKATVLNGSGTPDTKQFRPEDFDLQTAELSDLAGGTPEENAGLIEAILNGKIGPQRDVVVLNAAAGIVIAGDTLDMAVAIEKAQQSIDGGAALKVLRELRKIR